MTTNDTARRVPAPETCRICTGRGHVSTRVEGREYLIECDACEGEGIVERASTSRVLTFAGDVRNIAGGY